MRVAKRIKMLKSIFIYKKGAHTYEHRVNFAVSYEFYGMQRPSSKIVQPTNWSDIELLLLRRPRAFVNIAIAARIVCNVQF